MGWPAQELWTPKAGGGGGGGEDRGEGGREDSLDRASWGIHAFLLPL